MGRPKRITQDNIDNLVAGTESDRRSSVREMSGNVGMSHESVRKTRHANGLHYYNSTPVPPLSDQAKAQRVKFCQDRLQSNDDLPIIFTDESTVGQDMNKGGIWRHRGEIVPEGQHEQEAHPIQVMIWGAIGPNFKSDLSRCPPSVNGLTYIEMLAKSKILGTLDHEFGKLHYWWQQDNAPAHKPGWPELKKLCKCLPWPPHSPDLSPIEHMWAIMKNKLKGQKFRDTEHLFQAITAAWNAIDMTTVNNLCASFPRRCSVCIQIGGASLNGHWTEVHNAVVPGRSTDNQ
jgi:transposase